MVPEIGFNTSGPGFNRQGFDQIPQYVSEVSEQITNGNMENEKKPVHSTKLHTEFQASFRQNTAQR